MDTAVNRSYDVSMTEVNHTERQKTHEASYRRTVRNAMESIEAGQFTEQAVPRILSQLRAELGQCVELLLISPEFYGEQMGLLQEEVAAVMET